MPGEKHAGERRSTANRKKCLRKRRRRNQTSRPESTLEIIDRHLLQEVEINFNGEPTRMTVLAAIVYQLSQKERALNARASRVLLKYQRLIKPATDKQVKLEFAGDDDQPDVLPPAAEDDRG